MVVHKAWHSEEEMINTAVAFLKQTVPEGLFVVFIFSDALYMHYILAALKCFISSL
jgi:hypothetical protein